MDKIQICNKCKAINQKDIDKIMKLYPEIEFQVGCCNMCGIGRTKPFIVYNHIPIIANTFDEVLEKLKEKQESSQKQ